MGNDVQNDSCTCLHDASDVLGGVLPAIAGETACAPGMLCCSLVGNAFDGLSPADGVLFDLLRSRPT